jgi:methyl-accepting chemotaxis protein
LIGNSDIEDSLDKLDKLTQEEARMASAELLKMAHSVDGKVMGVDDRVKGVEGKIQDVRDEVQDVGNKVRAVDDAVHDIGRDVRGDVQNVGNKVQGVDDKLDQVNRSLSQTCSSFRALRQLHRESAQGQSFAMAFALRSINQS